jgi:Cu(I)/Ag(I) efflux system membrane protein CusA/SilA
MITGVMQWSLRNRALVLLGSLLVAAWGVWSVQHMALDAIPDLSDVQVIVKTPYPGQSPKIIEDQVTYPVTSALLAVPGSTAVRAFSMFGDSYVYVIFRDGTDPSWARSRVLERLSEIQGRLPRGVVPTLGPDASGLGWVFEYALVDRSRRYDPDRLRAIQDFFLRYELQSLPGVAEVASIGGMVRQFQVEVDPNRLAAYKLGLDRVAQAIRDSNVAGGGSVIEMGRSEHFVNAANTLGGLEDLRSIPLGVTAQGVPIRLQDVARVALGVETRRGVADLDGQGEVTGGIVVMRYGENALRTIRAVKDRLAELQGGLPPGVELVVTYDRSGLIHRAIGTMTRELVEESVIVAAACLVFLFHLRSAIVVVVTLPLGILAAFAIMQGQGVSANIMSLGGIAIAVGAMVDAAVVMIENLHKHLERAGAATLAGSVAPGLRWAIVQRSALEVGPTLFVSLCLIAVSFLPVLGLTGQEAKLFAPLAYTKTYAMVASAVLSITLVPALMGYFVRGRVAVEMANPLNRLLHRLYRPVLSGALRRPVRTVMLCGVLVASVAWPLARLGSEFMPPLDEGELLYMPTTLPGVSVDEAASILQDSDRLIAQMPQVQRVFGKAGRADSATDPAPLSMFETTILLRPREEWPGGESMEELVRRLDDHVRLPGLTNSWGYPIRTRIDMLSTGIRTPAGIKVMGPDLEGISALALRIGTLIGDTVPGTRNVFSDRASRGHYIDIALDRVQAARYGVTAADVQRLVGSAIGGEDVDTLIEGRSRFSINLRYPPAFRDTLGALAAARVTTPSGAQVPLGILARIGLRDGPTEIKSENGRLVAYVYLDVAGRDLGGYLEEAGALVKRSIQLQPGYSITWSGQFGDLQRARERFQWIIPATLMIVMILLLLHFHDLGKTLVILGCLPLSLVGGVWLVYLLDYRLSVAVMVGFIALAGVAAEFGLVMLLYLDLAIAEAAPGGAVTDRATLRTAIIHGALLRIRPKMMTVSVILAGLLPVMIASSAGADVMKRVAAPLLGGMVTAPVLSLIVIPVIYAWWQGRGLPPRGDDPAPGA